MKNSIDLGPMERHIAFQIQLTWRAIRKWLLADANDGVERVTRGSYSVPMLIGINPGISPQEIAATLHLDASKVAVLLRAMEEAGQLTRVPSPSDGRKVGVHLTPSGEAFVTHADRMADRIESRWREVLTEAEVDELVRLLLKIRLRKPSSE